MNFDNTFYPITTNSPYYVQPGASPIAKMPAEVLYNIFSECGASSSLPLVSAKWSQITREKSLSYPLLQEAMPGISSMLVKTDVLSAYDEINNRVHGIWGTTNVAHATQELVPTFITINAYARCFIEYKNLMELALAVRMHIKEKTSLKEKLTLEQDPALRLPHIKNWFEENKEELAKLSGLSIQIGDLTEIPEELNYFTGLETLSFRGCQITSIPGHFGRDLPLLRSVDLRQNKIRSISPEFSARNSNIHKLSLDGNLITELPDDFGLRLPNLTELDLTSNQLKHVPASLGTSCLGMYRLGLSNNQIEELPEDFGSSWTKLRFCELKGNKLEKLPALLGSQSVRIMLFNADWDLLEEYPAHLAKFSPVHKAQPVVNRSL